MYTKNIYNTLLLISILLFELFHVLSHTIHINGKIQTNITHLLAYIVNISYFILLYIKTKILPNYFYIIIFVLLIFIDLYSFITQKPFIIYLTTQFLIFILLFLCYYQYLPLFFKNKIPIIIILTVLILILFVNEMFNCKYLLEKYPNVSFHSLIEITAIFIVYLICSIFYKL